MLPEAQRVQTGYRDLRRVIASQIAKEHEKKSRKRLPWSLAFIFMRLDRKDFRDCLQCLLLF